MKTKKKKEICFNLNEPPQIPKNIEANQEPPKNMSINYKTTKYIKNIKHI